MTIFDVAFVCAIWLLLGLAVCALFWGLDRDEDDYTEWEDWPHDYGRRGQ